MGVATCAGSCGSGYSSEARVAMFQGVSIGNEIGPSTVALLATGSLHTELEALSGLRMASSIFSDSQWSGSACFDSVNGCEMKLLL